MTFFSDSPTATADNSDDEFVRAAMRSSVLPPGPLGELAIRSFRIRPRQPRAMASINRILMVAIETACRTPPDRATLGNISRVAGVTPQAAYRYLGSADEAVSAGMRCISFREQENIIEQLVCQVLSDEWELASAVVKLVLDARDELCGAPAHLRSDFLTAYREAGLSASPLIAKLICRGTYATDIRRNVSTRGLATALIATFAIATSPASGGALPQRSRHDEDMLASLFVAMLGSCFTP